MANLTHAELWTRYKDARELNEQLQAQLDASSPEMDRLMVELDAMKDRALKAERDIETLRHELKRHKAGLIKKTNAARQNGYQEGIGEGRKQR